MLETEIMLEQLKERYQELKIQLETKVRGLREAAEVGELAAAEIHLQACLPIARSGGRRFAGNVCDLDFLPPPPSEGGKTSRFWEQNLGSCDCPVPGAPQVVLVEKRRYVTNTGVIRDAGSIPGSGRSPGGEHGNHSSLLTWRIPWTKEPGGPQSTGSHRVRHD